MRAFRLRPVAPVHPGRVADRARAGDRQVPDTRRPTREGSGPALLSPGALSVDALLERARREAPSRASVPAATLAEPVTVPEATGEPVDLDELRESLKRVSADDSKALAKLILKGAPFAEEGARDDTLNRACGLCVCAMPAGTPTDAILEILRPSILSLPGEPPVGAPDWLDEARDMIERAQVRRAENDARRAEENERIRRRFSKQSAASAPPTPGGVGEPPKADRLTPYTSEELEAWAKENGCEDADEFSQRWIISKGKAHWVFVEGRYCSPISTDDLPTSVLRDFARAPIDTYRPNKQGDFKPRKIREILDEHSTVARHVRASLILQKSRYDEGTQTFEEAVCPLRPIAAVEHPEIDKWLRLLGGKHAEKLLDWVASCPRLERQICALYFDGAAGVGKSLFAGGLARLWTKGGPSEINKVLGGFNDVLTECPLCVADEGLPAQKNITADLRRLVGTSARNLSRKFLPTCSLDGAIRLVLAGNNDRMLDLGDDLGVADLNAVAERFFYLKPDPAARTYLLEVGGPPVVDTWIKQDKIAEHALWLSQTRGVVQTDRFLVTGTPEEFHSHLVTSGGIPGLVTEWLVRYLADPRTLKFPETRILVGNGQVWANTEALARESSWKDRVPSAPVPSATKIGRALANLSEGAVRLKTGDRHLSYHRVRVDFLLGWAERAQVGDLDVLLQRIAAPCEPIAAHLRSEKRPAAPVLAAVG